jgi:sugar phosphate isomerase/epimerase
MTRRELLAGALAPRHEGLRIGVMDGIMRLRSKPESVAAARRLGFEGLQVTLGPGNAPFREDAGLARKFAAEAKRAALPLVATYIDTLHQYCLQRDRQALEFAAEGIRLTSEMGSPILMLVFFGNCALDSRREMDAVAAPLKELCREAERRQITLGFENTLKAADALRVLDQVGSKALKVYYDIGNATNLYSEEPARAIREIGGDRICQFHFKDKGYLGEGKVDVPAALDAIEAIGWRGYIVLETGAPSGDVDADLARNLAYLRTL